MAVDENDLVIPELAKKPWGLGKKILLGIVIAAMCVAGYFVYNQYHEDPVTYLTMAVSQGNIINQVETTGTVTPLHEIDLYFKQQGTLKQLNVQTGDAVKAGQLLSVQDDSDLQASVEQAKSDLRQAELKLRQSELDYEKTKTTAEQQEQLYAAGAITESDYQQSKRDLEAGDITLEQAKASIKTAKAKLVIAESDLSQAQLKAPFDGVAAQVNGEVGQYTGNSSSPLFHLISNDLMIEAAVNEADIGRVKVGQEVSFTTTSLEDKTFKGVISRISPQSTATNNVQQFQVDISVKGDTTGLLAGMSVTANIIINQQQNVTTVPTLALTYAKTYMSTAMASRTSSSNMSNAKRSATNTNSTKTKRTGRKSINGSTSSKRTTSATMNKNRQPVVVLSNGQPVVKWITVGTSDDQNTQVTKGLTAGDQVVIGTKSDTEESATSTDSSSSSSNNSNSRSGMSGIGGMSGGMGGPPPN
ncbi:MAG: efflux RND transporter periplasmic adaptor subunit [Chitinophagales bacterium]